MLRLVTPLFALLLTLAPLPLSAQTVTVGTLVEAGSDIDDGLAIGPDGALYGSRWGGAGQTVTRVDLSTGATSTHATGFRRANGLAFGPDGSLYAADYGRGLIRRIPSSGPASTFYQATETTLSGVAYDLQNDVIYIASYDGDWIKRLSLSGEPTDIDVEGLAGPAGLAFDDQNRLHIANFDNGNIFRLDGRSLTLIASLSTQIGFLAYGGGQFFATGINSHRIYAISPTGDVTTLAGTGTAGLVDGPASSAQFNGPNGIVANISGDTLYVSDSKTRAVRRIVIQTSTDAEVPPTQMGALHPPVPNPVTSSTEIRFDLGTAQSIELTLHDALGRHVQSLASGLRSEGRHAVPMDVRDLAPGVYLVTLRAGDTVQSRQLVRR